MTAGSLVVLRVVGLTVDYYRQFARLGDRLALAPISERALRAVLDELYPDDSELGGRALRARARASEHVLELFARGATVANAPGSQCARGTRSSNTTTTTAARAPPRAPSCARSRIGRAARISFGLCAAELHHP